MRKEEGAGFGTSVRKPDLSKSNRRPRHRRPWLKAGSYGAGARRSQSYTVTRRTPSRRKRKSSGFTAPTASAGERAAVELRVISYPAGFDKSA